MRTDTGPETIASETRDVTTTCKRNTTLDNTMDALNDEDFVPDRITCGVGACAANGITQCFGGDLIVNCRPGAPELGDLTCDGRDEDCDGAVDVGGVREDARHP